MHSSRESVVVLCSLARLNLICRLLSLPAWPCLVGLRPLASTSLGRQCPDRSENPAWPWHLVGELDQVKGLACKAGLEGEAM